MQTPGRPSLNSVRRLAEFFGLKRNLVVLLVAIFVIGAGEELWMRFVPKYLQALGATVFVIGLYDALRTLLGAIYAYPGGVLSIFGDIAARFSPSTSFRSSATRWSCSFRIGARSSPECFSFFPGPAFRCPRRFRSSAQRWRPIATPWASASRSVIKRLPIMVAPFFGGILIDRFGVIDGVRIGLIVSIFLSAATILGATPTARRTKADRDGTRALEFLAKLARIQFADAAIALERHPDSLLRTHSLRLGRDLRDGLHRHERKTGIGVLTTVEMLAAILCIIPTSYFADRSQREPFVVVTFIMFTLFPISLLVSRSFTMLVVAFAIRGLKEFGDTSRKALIIGYCEPERRGQMVGAYYLVRDLIVSAAAIVGACLWKLGPRLNFLGAAAFGVAGTIFILEPSGGKSSHRRTIFKKDPTGSRQCWK